jgi:phosphoenolpyruvate synthase/pyruvate phosphate dikinase
MERILPLDRVTAADAGRAGGKAANLGELMRSGFPVPDGFVVFGEPRSEELEDALAKLGDQAVAVRSSALAEDLAEASFAGQYESFLDVRGPEAVREAIHRCRASAASSRVARYREERKVRAGTGIAVLVQAMVPARAAGVAFSVNPVT